MSAIASLRAAIDGEGRRLQRQAADLAARIERQEILLDLSPPVGASLEERVGAVEARLGELGL